MSITRHLMRPGQVERCDDAASVICHESTQPLHPNDPLCPQNPRSISQGKLRRSHILDQDLLRTWPR